MLEASTMSHPPLGKNNRHYLRIVAPCKTCQFDAANFMRLITHLPSPGARVRTGDHHICTVARSSERGGQWSDDRPRSCHCRYCDNARKIVEITRSPSALSSAGSTWAFLAPNRRNNRRLPRRCPDIQPINAAPFIGRKPELQPAVEHDGLRMWLLSKPRLDGMSTPPRN